MLRGVSAAEISLLEPVTQTLAAALVKELEMDNSEVLGETGNIVSDLRSGDSAADATGETDILTVRSPYFAVGPPLTH